MKVIFVILTIILFIGMIGEKDKDSARNYTMGFCVSAIVTALLTIM